MVPLSFKQLVIIYMKDFSIVEKKLIFHSSISYFFKILESNDSRGIGKQTLNRDVWNFEVFPEVKNWCPH